MNRLKALLSRLFRNEWREIAGAPFDCEIEVAVIAGTVEVLDGTCLRHGDDWLDAETLRPVNPRATHWRYRPLPMLPISCC
jgi:hypothetical protein